MQSRSVFVAKCATILSVPVLLYALESGPEPRKTGAPGDSTCAECHAGTLNANGNKIEVTFAGGTNYVPGERQRITIRITEPAQVFGFQMTARLGSNEANGQAGRFTTAEDGTLVLCNDGSTRSATGNCRDGQTVEFIEHSRPKSTGEFVVDWTPPATDMGPVKFYIAANAANANRQNTGDKIYTANFTLTPTAGGGARPSISQGGVGDAFNGQAGVASSTWTAIYGQNLSSVTRDWSGAPEFGEGRLPTSVAGTSVTINNRPAAVYFVSPGQVNVLAPTDDATGDVQVTITTSGGTVSTTARKSALLPSIYAPFARNNRLFATVVENSTGAILGTPGLEPRATRAVRPGDLIQIYATGLGPTNPAVPADRTVTTPAPTVNPPTVRFGEIAAEVLGAVLVNPGLYQINARAPANVADGEQPFTVEIGGVRSPNNVFITIQR